MGVYGSWPNEGPALKFYMSELLICNEGVEGLWRRCASDLNDSSLEFIPGHFVEMMAHHFLSEGFDGNHDIFEVVTVPTGRAGINRLAIRLSRAFNCYVTSAAKDRYGLAIH